MEILILAIIIGLLPAYIAKNKGYNFWAYWFFGAMLFIVALPWTIFMRTNQDELDRQKFNNGMKQCSGCAEFIRREATICRFCKKIVSA